MRLPQFFTSLSIGRKLGIGFAILIILSVITGSIGLTALDNYADRGDVVGLVGAMETNLLQARLAEKSFLMEAADDDLAKARKQSAAAGQMAESLSHQVSNSTDQARLATVIDGSAHYGDLLAEVATTQKSRDETVKKLEVDARKTESRLSTEDQLYVASAALKQMRRSERNFLIEGDDKAIKAFDDANNRALKSVKSSFVDKSVKEEVSGLFQAYSDSFHSAVDQVRKTHTLEQDMIDTARSILQATNDMKQDQLAKMKSDHQSAIVMIAVTMVIVILMGIGLAWVLGRSIVRPIREAVDVASKVASGDLRQQVSSNRKDELGQLLSALGGMVTNLRALVQGIDQGSNDIAASTGELSTVTEQTSLGMTQQRDQTDQVATAMNEMVATVSEVARSAEEAFSAANQASQTAADGETAVGETLAYVSELNTLVENVMQKLNGLQADTQNIGTVLDVIKSVAEQTNLLALNAAIEAARAGEQGRGFAVVADEVRSLAQRTQSSATEIETLITNLVSSAESSVTAMESGTRLAGQTLDSARTTGQTIEAIASAVEQIRQLNSQIATAAEEQSSVAEDINHNVTSIRDISDQSATAATQVASSSTELAQLGENLRRQVAQFSVQ
ncbi:methyl-accepting chemotaxis protein [Marinobacter mangrovi]|uniref:methyl-accepting chemotaxis protein n=1 Tax=Marinobacter mangrovi TaxID=2803918 RepID=UPI0019336962|nr:methyl-accepting chemotaxis protein [Marinobacter mangrovi]